MNWWFSHTHACNLAPHTISHSSVDLRLFFHTNPNETPRRGTCFTSPPRNSRPVRLHNAWAPLINIVVIVIVPTITTKGCFVFVRFGTFTTSRWTVDQLGRVRYTPSKEDVFTFALRLSRVESSTLALHDGSCLFESVLLPRCVVLGAEWTWLRLISNSVKIYFVNTQFWELHNFSKEYREMSTTLWLRYKFKNKTTVKRCLHVNCNIEWILW